MKKMILVALASTVLATPALAADRGWYVGLEGGLTFPRDEGIDVSFDDEGGIPLGGVSTESVSSQATLNSLFDIGYKTGHDIDLIAGYDFGLFRVEAELANKRAKHDDYNVFFEGGSIDGDGSTRVNSLMANFLLDVPVGNRWSLYAGPGIGFANVKVRLDIDDEDFSETIKDSGLALQGIAGVRYAVSDNLDLGLKYRYFEATKISDNSDEFCPGDDCQFKTRFRTHSVLASLIYNFGRPVAPAPAYVAPAPMAPAPVATQTCYDGSVIEASAMCPTPPAPPEPAPAPERG